MGSRQVEKPSLFRVPCVSSLGEVFASMAGLPYVARRQNFLAPGQCNYPETISSSSSRKSCININGGFNDVNVNWPLLGVSDTSPSLTSTIRGSKRAGSDPAESEALIYKRGCPAHSSVELGAGNRTPDISRLSVETAETIRPAYPPKPYVESAENSDNEDWPLCAHEGRLYIGHRTGLQHTMFSDLDQLPPIDMYCISKCEVQVKKSSLSTTVFRMTLTTPYASDV